MKCGYKLRRVVTRKGSDEITSGNSKGKDKETFRYLLVGNGRQSQCVKIFKVETLGAAVHFCLL